MTEIVSSQFWRVGSPRSRCQLIQGLVRILFLANVATFFLTWLELEWGRRVVVSFLVLLLIRTVVLSVRAPLLWPQ